MPGDLAGIAGITANTSKYVNHSRLRSLRPRIFCCRARATPWWNTKPFLFQQFCNQCAGYCWFSAIVGKSGACLKSVGCSLFVAYPMSLSHHRLRDPTSSANKTHRPWQADFRKWVFRVVLIFSVYVKPLPRTVTLRYKVYRSFNQSNFEGQRSAAPFFAFLQFFAWLSGRWLLISFLHFSNVTRHWHWDRQLGMEVLSLYLPDILGFLYFCFLFLLDWKFMDALA